ncbi:hypothetical protein LINPERHAP1_LOCUS42896 [Linum perenne]
MSGIIDSGGIVCYLSNLPMFRPIVSLFEQLPSIVFWPSVRQAAVARIIIIGAPAMDSCLGGGIPSQSIPGDGQLPPSLDNLFDSSIYLHSELPFRAEQRLVVV